jgi:hypothetical protein
MAVTTRNNTAVSGGDLPRSRVRDERFTRLLAPAISRLIVRGTRAGFVTTNATPNARAKAPTPPLTLAAAWPCWQCAMAE